jgi:hypothetical protein
VLLERALPLLFVGGRGRITASLFRRDPICKGAKFRALLLVLRRGKDVLSCDRATKIRGYRQGAVAKLIQGVCAINLTSSNLALAHEFTVEVIEEVADDVGHQSLSSLSPSLTGRSTWMHGTCV